MVLINSFFLDTTFLLPKLISSLSSPLLEGCEGLSLSRALVAELARQGRAHGSVAAEPVLHTLGFCLEWSNALRVCQTCFFAGATTRTVRAACGAAVS